MRNYSRQLNKDLYFDPYLFISITLLSLMGLVFLFSASQGSYDATIKQFVFVIFGLLLMFFLSQPDPDFYKNNSLIFLISSIILIIATFIFGNEIKGVSQNAIDLSNDVIEIDQFGTKHSLNISVCSGILIWEFYKRLS